MGCRECKGSEAGERGGSGRTRPVAAGRWQRTLLFWGPSSLGARIALTLCVTSKKRASALEVKCAGLSQGFLPHIERVGWRGREGKGEGGGGAEYVLLTQRKFVFPNSGLLAALEDAEWKSTSWGVQSVPRQRLPVSPARQRTSGERRRGGERYTAKPDSDLKHPDS